jgi:ribonuclease HI
MLIEVYSDGSATTSDKPGGYGFVICVDGVKVCEGSGSFPRGSNNFAEISAAISGLEYVASYDLTGVDVSNTEPDIVLISDSKLVCGYADGSYQCRKPHLLPLMLKLRKVYRKLGAKTRWVRGHSGDEFNEVCDRLAKAAREALSNQLQQNKVSNHP